MNTNKSLPIALSTCLLILAACAPAAPAAPGGASAEDPAATKEWQSDSTPIPGGGLLLIVKADGSSQPLTQETFDQLPVRQLTVDGIMVEGPRLVDALAAAGVTDFTQLILANERRSITLTRAQVDDNTLLIVTNHGILGMTSTQLMKNDWMRYIQTITVQ